MVSKLLFPPATPVNWLEVGEEQVRRLIEVGAPKQVGVIEAKYLDDGMKQVQSYEYRLDLAGISLDRLWLVDYRLSDQFLAEAGGVRSYIDLDRCTVVNGLVLPEGLAVIQGQWGKYKGFSPKDACSRMSEIEEPGVSEEGLTAFLYWGEDLLKECFMDFPGSRSEGGDVPYLYLYDGWPVLDASYEDDANPAWGSVSRGKFA